MRPRIQKQTIDSKINDMDRKIVNRYIQLGFSPKEAWSKIKVLNFQSDMRFVTVNSENSSMRV